MTSEFLIFCKSQPDFLITARFLRSIPCRVKLRKMLRLPTKYLNIGTAGVREVLCIEDIKYAIKYARSLAYEQPCIQAQFETPK